MAGKPKEGNNEKGTKYWHDRLWFHGQSTL